MDKKILKPILVYKYNEAKMKRHDEVNDFMLSYANILGSVIGDEEYPEDGGEFAFEDVSYGNPSQF